MKKAIAFLTAILMVTSFAWAQEDDEKENGQKREKTTSSKRVEANLTVAFPMNFGFVTPMGLDYLGSWTTATPSNFLDSKLFQNFVYSIDFVGVKVGVKSNGLDGRLSLRGTYMNYVFNNTDVTFDGTTPVSVAALNPSYDGKKSKLVACYLGIPFRLTYKIDKAKFYAGAGADYMVYGFSKYRNIDGKPKYVRTGNQDIFNKLRGSVEAGISYGSIGVWASYSFTPFFDPSLSNARLLSFGLSLGI